MKSPMCKLCGTTHWSNEPHAWAEKASDRVTPSLPPAAKFVHINVEITRAPEPKASPAKPAEDIKDDAPKASRKGRGRPAIDPEAKKANRAAYMRSYRAKHKP